MTDNIKVDKHIEVLDGLRAIAMVFVVWFHFWQQTWLTPCVKLPEKVLNITKYMGITGMNLEGFVRYGFVFVDMLILLSAFCNFYPYARAMLLGEVWPDTLTFYKKRAVRILPSYYLALMVMLIVILLEGIPLSSAILKDLLAHVFCVAPFFPGTYLSPYFNGVLWTVQIEVLYYIVMPWLAKAFRKWPVATCLGLWGVGIISSNVIVCNYADSIRFYGNHILTFAGCYANGMLAAMLYIIIKSKGLESIYTRLVATITTIGCVFYLSGMLRELGKGQLQVVQLQLRFEMSLVFSVFLLALPFASKGVKWLFANRAVRFLAVISYNWYLWHQYIAVKLKQYHIPYWEGEVPPNQTGDIIWMWKYQILIVVVSLIVASFLTYFFEKPIAKGLFMKSKNPRFKEPKLFHFVLAAMFLAIAMILPFLTGQIPQIGNMLCPMHIPVLLCGYLCGPWYGAFVGFVAPLLRFLLFGMPPIFPTGVAMCFELAVYGLVSGILYRRLPKTSLNVYVSLITAMLAGRFMWGLVRIIIYGLGKSEFGWAAFLSGAFTTAIPGIILHIVLIPILVMALKRAMPMLKD